MSLFDVIKYPISDPPKPHQLESLPEDIVFLWCSERFVFSQISSFPRALGLLKFALNTPDKIIRLEYINLLRKIIKEYNEPV